MEEDATTDENEKTHESKKRIALDLKRPQVSEARGRNKEKVTRHGMAADRRGAVEMHFTRCKGNR